MTANMISAYYDCTVNGQKVFDGLKISKNLADMQQQGRYDVLHINMQDFLSESNTVSQMLERIQKRLAWDIKKTYPDIEYFDLNYLADVLADVYAVTKRQFVVVIDEWDCIFREYTHDTEAQKSYLDFLRNFLKDKKYIALAYMTGILPIKKYGTHSALNMFIEFSMEHPDQLASYVGFTEKETQTLCNKYKMDFAECKAWYDGYSFLIELKWNQDAETAIRQIQEKEYEGTLKNFAGEVLLVGINYDKRTKKHECKIQKVVNEKGPI